MKAPVKAGLVCTAAGGAGLPCSPDAVTSVEVEGEALTGKGVRLRAPDASFTLASLPPEELRAIADCEVVEVVYPDGRVVYVKGGWLKRLVELRGQGAARGGEGERH